MTDPDRRSIRREALLVWVGSLALTGLFGALALFVPFVSDNLLAFVAAVFLYLPAATLWRRGYDLADYGLRASPVIHGVALFVGVSVVVLPLFALGHRAFQGLVHDAEPHLTADRLVRFDRELDGRPDLPISDGSLRLWIEGPHLVALWAGEGPVEVRFTLTPREGADPVRALRGFRQTDDGRLLRASRGRTEVTGDSLTWRRTDPGGLGFDASGLDHFRVETSAPELRLGRFGVPADAPYQADRSAWWWLWMFATQLILVAVPEEWFYRGYLQQRLGEAFTRRWRILGADLGPAWILTSVMFALGHLVLDPRPSRLAVFFPSLLFGWMKARTGSILAPSLFHALANVCAQALNYVYLG